MLTLDLCWSHPISLSIAGSIQPGEVIALLGPSGCGKTTFLHTLAGLQQAQGQLTLNGTSLLLQQPEDRPVALAAQKPVLFPHWTIAEHIKHIRKLRKNQSFSPQVISEDELIADIGLETLLQKRPQQLSGGQQQRVAVLLALLQVPKLLLLDEAFSALDEQNKQRVLHTVKKAINAFKSSAIVVSHQLRDCAALANTAWLMSETGIDWQGSIHEGLRRYQGSAPMYSFLTAEYAGKENHLSVFMVGNQKLFAPATNMFCSREIISLSLCADDIGISLSPPETTSFANCLWAEVCEITPDHYGAYIFCRLPDGQIIQIHITQHSRVKLNLAVQNSIYLVFKAGAINVI